MVQTATDKNLIAEQVVATVLGDETDQLGELVDRVARGYDEATATSLARSLTEHLAHHPDGLRELEALVYKLALHFAGRTVCAADVLAVANGYGVRLLARLPSRRTPRRDVVAALASTRKGSGAFNKTRAARYLGWDPATLAARLRTLGIERRLKE